ncbi:hypothetical protein WJX81_000355 [Elliptochloris bilobata]
MEEVEGAEGTSCAATPPSTRPPTPEGPCCLSPAAPAPAAGSGHGAAGARRNPSSPRGEISTTLKIRSLGREAAANELISERLNHWKAAMRERGEELRTAVEEWQAKRSGTPGTPRLSAASAITTGFLDGTHPIVDAYELKVRLEHMLQRLRALQDAAATARPTQLLPHLWVAGAVEANSLHLLRQLGITHLLNATEDLLLPEPSAGFQCLRCPLRDVEDEDIERFFEEARRFIDAAAAASGSALVHCHEGKSRSVTLVLAYMMQTQDWSLRRALEMVAAQRPGISPNAGFMGRLGALEERLRGSQTVRVKRTKPEPRTCPQCGVVAGVSQQSLLVHMRTKHGAAAAAHEAR